MIKVGFIIGFAHVLIIGRRYKKCDNSFMLANVNVYASCDRRRKHELWSRMSNFIF